MKLRILAFPFALAVIAVAYPAAADETSSAAVAADEKDADRDKEKKDKKRDEIPWIEKNCVWGLRASALDVRGSDADEGTFGLSLFTWSDKYTTRDVFAYRGSILGMLGGGSGGFEGGLGGGLQWGVRAPVGADHGPFMRIGFDGLMIGNQKLFASYFEIPTVMAGYQYLAGATVLEVGGRGGAVVEGRFNTGDDARRKLGGLDYGAYAAVHLAEARFDVWWMRVNARRSEPKTPVDILRGSACAYFGIFGACGDVWYMRGDVQFGVNTATSEALYGGVLIGLREGVP